MDKRLKVTASRFSGLGNLARQGALRLRQENFPTDFAWNYDDWHVAIHYVFQFKSSGSTYVGYAKVMPKDVLIKYPSIQMICVNSRYSNFAVDVLQSVLKGAGVFMSTHYIYISGNDLVMQHCVGKNFLHNADGETLYNYYYEAEQTTKQIVL